MKEMKAILSGAAMGKWGRFFAHFGYAPVKRSHIQADGVSVLNIILPSENRNDEKIVRKTKKILKKYRIKEILFEKDIKMKYAKNFEADYHLVNGQRVMLSKLQESMVRIFKLYGFKKGKLRLAWMGNTALPQLKEALKANQEYFQFLVFQGKETPEKREIAEELYDEFGISTVFKESLEETDCDMLLYTDGPLQPYGKQVKVIFNVSDRPFQEKVPVLNDCLLELPAELRSFRCRQIELAEILEREYPLTGFCWNS